MSIKRSDDFIRLLFLIFTYYTVGNAQLSALFNQSFFITFIGLDLLGGWSELKSVLGENKEQFKLWRPIIQEGIPWWKNNDFPCSSN